MSRTRTRFKPGTLKKGNPIKLLQESIVDLLAPYGIFKDKKAFYLENIDTVDQDFNLEEYHTLLDFVNKSLIHFKTENKSGIETYYYSTPDSPLTLEDKQELSKKKDKYEEYVDVDYYLESKTRSAKIKKELIEDTFFEKKTDEDIIKMIKNTRLPNLHRCSENPNKSNNNKLYYSTEKERMDAIFSTNPDISLGELADKIIWSRVSMLEPDLDSQNPDKIILIFNDPANQQYLLQLMTFIPIEYFEKNDDGKWKIKSTKMKEFLISSNKKDNIQQIVLGFSSDLSVDFFKEFRQLAHCYSFQFDSLNNCGELVDWSLKMNFLIIYLFSRSLKKVFPIRFKMPNDSFSYNSSNNSYFFKKTFQLPSSSLFNKNKFAKIIGITLFNTKYKYKRATESINNYTRKTSKDRIFIILHCKVNFDKILDIPMKLSAIDRHLGKNITYIDYNIFLSNITSGLFETQGVTHQELVSVNNFLKLKPYIIGDDTKNIFFTARDEADEELSRLIEELNLKKIKINTEYKRSEHESKRIKITLNTLNGGNNNKKTHKRKVKNV